MIDLTSRHFIVFGASRGIGAACAAKIADAGGTVTVGYHRDEDAAKKVCSEINHSGGEAESVQADIGDEKAVREALAWSRERFGRLDGMVVSSGILRFGHLVDTTLEEWDEVIRTNLTGSFLAIREFARQHPSGESAAIVVVTSTSGQHGGGGGNTAAYPVSKAGQIRLMKNAASALADRGIRVNCIAPAWTETDMAAPHLERLGRAGIAANFPLGRIGRPHDIAGPACFLLSDLAGFITGETLTVDGGMSMKG